MDAVLTAEISNLHTYDLEVLPLLTMFVSHALKIISLMALKINVYLKI